MTDSHLFSVTTVPMLEKRTRLPKLVVTDAELPYAREVDADQEIVFFSFSLSDLDGIDIGCTRVNREDNTHVNADKTVFVYDCDVGYGRTEDLSLILDREGSSLAFECIWIRVPNAKLNFRNPETNLAAIVFLLSVEPVLIWVDIARFLKGQLHVKRNASMGV